MKAYFALFDLIRCYKAFLSATIVAFFATTTTTFAVPITFQLEGKVVKVDSPLIQTFYPGKKFTLTYTFDSQATQTGDLSGIGIFEYANAIQRMVLTSGNYTAFANTGSIANNYAEGDYEVNTAHLNGPNVYDFHTASLKVSWDFSFYHRWFPYLVDIDEGGPLEHPSFVPDISPLDRDCIETCILYDADGKPIYDRVRDGHDGYPIGQPVYNANGNLLPTKENNGRFKLTFRHEDGDVLFVDGRLTNAEVLSNPIDEALVAYWVLNDGNFDFGGTAYDYSGNQHNGKLNNGLAWRGDLLYFFGDNGYIDAGTFDVPGEALTLTAWVKSEDFANCRYNGCRILTKSAHTSNPAQYWMISTVLINNETHLRFSLKTNGETSHLYGTNDDLQENEWMHVAAVYDGTNMYLYKNGNEIGRLPKTGPISTNNTIPIWIGGNPYYVNTRPWKGNIANVRVYKRALTADEVKLVRDEDRLALRE